MSIRIPKTHAASDEAIAELKKRFGNNVSHSYLAFLREFDGATPEDNVFKIAEDNSAGIDQFIPAHEITTLHKTIEGFPKNVLPIAEATGGNFVYLDPTSGMVYFWDHENDEADVKLADSFDEFLTKLQPFKADEIKLKPGQVKKVWIDPKFKPKF